MLAFLADPKFVDSKIEALKKQIPPGKEEARTFVAFQRLVKITTEHFNEDPSKVKAIFRAASPRMVNGKWMMEKWRSAP